MKMKNCILLLILAMLSNAFSQIGPRLTFDTTSFDTGVIPEGPQKKNYFKFQNTGDSILVIKNVVSSCGCIVPHWSKDSVKPGGRGEIIGLFNTSGRIGHFNKSLTVNSNDKQNPIQVLFLRGKVVPYHYKIKFSYHQQNDTVQMSNYQNPVINKLDNGTTTLVIQNNDTLPHVFAIDTTLNKNDYNIYFTSKYMSLKSKIEIKKNWRKLYFDTIAIKPKEKIYLNIVFKDKSPFRDYESIQLKIDDETLPIEFKYELPKKTK
jgi:Protein of unknown function (DUF1573)